ncbi:hypothetical protein RW092_05180, partial [Paenibacillus sp. 3LSP]|uniref:hypothetical protein n=1 Tax=Paenibacillus sp. 3LSP TaxID=2800795 RepID=UPI0028FD47A7
WQEDKTFNGVTKPWIEHIKDTNPDILIIAFGENNASIASAKQVMYYIDQVTSYINTNFTKKPTISWITAPRPTLALDSNWGSVGYQCGIDLAAYTTRKRGYSKGHYIIDANRVSNLKRVGVDYTSPYLETLAVTDSDIQEYLSGVYQKSGSEYTMQNAGDFMYFDVALRDFSFDFNVKFAPSSAGNENIWIAFNQLVRGSEQETVVLVMPKATSGVARI